jgi:hypothetical protein
MMAGESSFAGTTLLPLAVLALRSARGRRLRLGGADFFFCFGFALVELSAAIS